MTRRRGGVEEDEGGAGVLQGAEEGGKGGPLVLPILPLGSEVGGQLLLLGGNDGGSGFLFSLLQVQGEQGSTDKGHGQGWKM